MAGKINGAAAQGEATPFDLTCIIAAPAALSLNPGQDVTI
jgi:hypothetical protein